jgi:hypothetical protein
VSSEKEASFDQFFRVGALGIPCRTSWLIGSGHSDPFYFQDGPGQSLHLDLSYQ